MSREQRTARLTVLIDPDKKAVFEALCALDDVTSSQVVRRLVRDFIEQRSGHPWRPGEAPEQFFADSPLVKSKGEQRKRAKA